MTSDAAAEYERVLRRYPPARPRQLVVVAVLAAVLGAAGALSGVGWTFSAGVLTAFAAWELTKWRVRRNAHDFAQRSG